MRRKIVILFIAAFTSVFGAVACSGEVQVEEPDEVPVKVQDSGEQQKDQPQKQDQPQKNDQPQKQEQKQEQPEEKGVG